VDDVQILPVMSDTAPGEFSSKPGESSEVKRFLKGRSQRIQGFDSTKSFVKYQKEPDD